MINVKKEKSRSPSQTLRSVLYRVWEQHPVSNGTCFLDFYEEEMEKIISEQKSKLN